MLQTLRLLSLVLPLASAFSLNSQSGILIEAERFLEKGGWVTDPQFIQQMGSTYLMAHGLGVPVPDATTRASVPSAGQYHIWARTRDWAPGDWEPPGQFRIEINGDTLANRLGLEPAWGWEYAGSKELEKGEFAITLRDLTGFNARCDAVFLSRSTEEPPTRGPELASWRAKMLQEPPAPDSVAQYDLVVTGGGLAGCAASIAAAEQGLKVALIHDRPVLGGNASQEIRVHTLGIYGKFERILKLIDTEHYPNGSPEAIFDQQKRDRNVQQYENIDIYYNWRAYDARADSAHTIQYVDARHTSGGERIRFKAPWYVDSTGDGWIGYWAGADYTYGRGECRTIW